MYIIQKDRRLIQILCRKFKTGLTTLLILLNFDTSFHLLLLIHFYFLLKLKKHIETLLLWLVSIRIIRREDMEINFNCNHHLSLRMEPIFYQLKPLFIAFLGLEIELISLIAFKSFISSFKFCTALKNLSNDLL